VSGRPGPVFLEIPPDVLNVTARADEVVWPARGGRLYRSGPDPSQLQSAADLINKAQKPVIIGGSGVGSSGCTEQLATFIDTTGSPFVLLSTGRGCVADDHPLSLWDGGLLGIMTALSLADLVIALGVRFNWQLMFGQLFPHRPGRPLQLAAHVRTALSPGQAAQGGHRCDRNRPQPDG
jgi:acetolactate synthase-1/2/3 large subunit